MDQSVGRPQIAATNKIDNYGDLLSPKAKKKAPIHHVGGMHAHHQPPSLTSTGSGPAAGVGPPFPPQPPPPVLALTPSGETSSSTSDQHSSNPAIDNVETVTLHYSFEGDMTKASVALFDEHIIYPDPNKDISKILKDYTVSQF